MMGYTHYWKRVERFEPKQFEKVVKDFKELMKHLSLFVPLSDGCGQGKPVINNKRIWFNGMTKCGHIDRNLGITWPDDKAKGIAFIVERYQEIPTRTLVTMLCGEEEELALKDSDVSGTWFIRWALFPRFD